MTLCISTSTGLKTNMRTRNKTRYTCNLKRFEVKSTNNASVVYHLSSHFEFGRHGVGKQDGRFLKCGR